MAAVSCAQDMLFVMRVLESMGLKVKKPMILEIDNRGAVSLANNWSVGGRTRHVGVRQCFLRELKESRILITRWKSGSRMAPDLFTKNLPRSLHQRHMRTYCGDDEYSKEESSSKGRVSWADLVGADSRGTNGNSGYGLSHSGE